MSDKDKYLKLDEENQCSQQGESESVPLKIKSLDGNVRDVQANINHTIQQFKQEFYENEMQMNKLIKLIYRGRLLKDDEIISSLNLPPNTFIHVSIQNNPNAQEAKPAESSSNSQSQQQQQGNQEQGAFANFSQNQQLQSQDLRTILYQNSQQNGNNNQDGPAHQAVPMEQLTQEQQELIERSKRIQFTLGFIMGLLFGYYGLLFVIICTLSTHQKYGAFAGFVAKILYFVLFASDYQSQVQQENKSHIVSPNGNNVSTGQGYIAGFMDLDFSITMMQYLISYFV